MAALFQSLAFGAFPSAAMPIGTDWLLFQLGPDAARAGANRFGIDKASITVLRGILKNVVFFDKDVLVDFI